MSFTVDTTGFKAMAIELAAMGAVPFESVIRSESAHILERCVQLTPASTNERITNSVTRKFNNYAGGEYGEQNTRGLYPRISIAANAGHKWWVDNSGGKRVFYIMNGDRKWSDARWAKYQAEEADRLADLKTMLPKAKAARGLAKNSWVQAADALGLSIDAPGYARAATPSNGQIYQNGHGQEFKETDSYFVELTNRYPALVRSGGGPILQRAVNGRLRYFEINLEKGLFDNLKARAERYPGVFVT
jgi:hypothetical protein